jgi:hypothetical protein
MAFGHASGSVFFFLMFKRRADEGTEQRMRLERLGF